MNRISARLRIAVGLVALLVSVMLLAVAAGMIPSSRDAIIAGRARVCETLAIGSSVLAARGDTAGLQAMLQGVCARDSQILSAAVRTIDGKVVSSFGDHDRNWRTASADGVTDSHVYVPIWSNEKKWGAVEVSFQPLGGGILAGALHRPDARLILFVAGICFVVYMVYLGKMLQHLDPSQVVPARVRSALDTLAEGLLVLDDRERIVLANRAFAAVAGKVPDDLLGSGVAQLPWVKADGAINDDYPWTRAIRDGAPQRNITLRLPDASGSLRSFVVNCSPVPGDDGKHRGVLVSFDDVTVLEAQKIELDKARQSAEAANRAKGEFLARMSHEIRTPMNAILGFTDVLRRGFEENPAERQEYLDTIHSSGRHLMELINDILDLSKIESGRIQIEQTRCSPHQLITEVVSVLRGRAKEKAITLDYAWDGGLPESILTDPTRLRQVLTNLVGNAIKFTETGGVKIVARMLKDEASPKLGIDVIDTGIGIQPESIDKLFQPFVQADTSITRRFGGTGLGLSISRQLAEAMGGRLAAQSEYGKGSTFTLTIETGALDGITILPSQPTAAHHSETAKTTHLPPIRVLSVEDGESNQKLITLVLRRAGAAQVDIALDGQAGVEMALRQQYDVILLDMQMPIMDGYSAAAAMRAAGLTMPIIAMTAHTMKGEEEKCIAAGCVGYVPKPIDVDRLVQTVATAVGARAIAPSVTHSPEPVADASVESAPPTLQSTLPMDDADFREIVVEFIERLREQLASLQTAWEQRDLPRIASLAHWIKGSGGTAGFNAFTAPAKRLEQAAKDQQLDEIAGAIAELQQLASRIAAPTNDNTGNDSTINNNTGNNADIARGEAA